MADPLEEEMDNLVAQANDGSEDSEDDETPEGATNEETPAEEKPTRKRRVRSTGRKRRKKSEKARTMEELEVDELLPEGFPTPEQNIKGLGDLYAKYGVGERPEFKVHLYRTYPKIAPGGTKFDGFYDEYDIPLTEQQIQSDYGGGQYRVVVVGPHPTSPRLPKNYASHSIGLAGEPNYDRMPRALQGKKDKEAPSTAGNPPPLPIGHAQENPKLVEAAFKMLQGSAESERQERQRLEQKFEQRMATSQTGDTALAEAERRRADDLIRAEREKSEAERTYMERRMQEITRDNEERTRRLESELRSRPSVTSELQGLLPLLQRDDGGAKVMLEQLLQKHRDEISAIQVGHRDFVKSLREGHQSELAALRAAHESQLAAEREASKSREERVEDRLRSEREERERDRTRHREALEDRDRHWKDRMEGALQTQQSAWESRHQAQLSTYEQRIQWLQQEVDKLKGENYELRNKQEEKGDFFTQLSKHKEVSSFLKDLTGSTESSSASSGGGIGLTQQSGDEWKQTLAEGVSERMPAIMEKLFGSREMQQVQQPSQQTMEQQNFSEGQVIDTPQGKMEVVRNPADGQLALAPKTLLDQHRAQAAAYQQAQGDGGGLLPSRSAPQRRQAPRRQAPRPPADPRRKSRSAGIMAVPDLSQGLPKRRPPWEGGGDDDLEPSPASPPMPRSATRKPETSAPPEPLELNAMERQALNVIAKEVHESVMHADEPEEFASKMLEKYPANILQQIVGGYTDRQIVQGVTQLQPGSAGATPAGRQFMAKAFSVIREALK